MDPTAFIAANTERLAPPLVPEITLHLAHEMLPIWQLTEEELADQGLPPPFWAFAWAGGQALARYVLDNPGLVKGKGVIDFGAGSGLAGLAAAKAGASRVLAVDIDPFAAAACTLNAATNKLPLEATSADLLSAPVPDWAEVMLIADMFYEQPLASALEAWLAPALGRGALVLVGDPKRSFFPADRFTCLETYEVATSRELEDLAVRRTSVWRMEG